MRRASAVSSTKQSITVLGRLSGLVRLVSRYMDLNMVHRSFIGWSNWDQSNDYMRHEKSMKVASQLLSK